MNAEPVVSVVIAVHNGALFLADAVASVRAQTYRSVELVVVDDGSVDGTPGLARGLEVDRLVELPENTGVSIARNIGAALATGELLTFLDADDVMAPTKIETQVAHLAGNPECDWVLTGQELVVDPGVEPPRWVAENPHVLADPPPLQLSALIRMRRLLLSGGFDPSFRLSEDVELMCRSTRSGARIDRIPDQLVRRRIHGSNATYQSEVMARELVRAVWVNRPTRHRPLVSVIVPAFNGADFLAEAVESIRAQRMGDAVEVVVVDDGSTDDTGVVARAMSPPVTFARQPNAGIGAARNHGVLLSRGTYLAFLDADDLFAPDKLATQLAAFEADPALDAVFGHVEEFVSPGLDDSVRERLRPRPSAPSHVAWSMVLTREAFATVGPFSVKERRAEFLEWYARAIEAGLRMATVPQTVARRRLHANNHSRQHHSVLAYPAVLRSSIHRRRAARS